MTEKAGTMSQSVLYSAQIYFSYNQFQVFDSSVELPGCAWTDAHQRQGFARRERNVSFATILEFGNGDVAVHMGPYEDRGDHERVIEVPIEVSSGEVVIGGPEEYPNKHIVRMPLGHYRLVAAQKVTGAEQEAIDLYFEKLGDRLAKSRIILVDDALSPPLPLFESVEVA